MDKEHRTVNAVHVHLGRPCRTKHAQQDNTGWDIVIADAVKIGPASRTYFGEPSMLPLYLPS